MRIVGGRLKGRALSAPPGEQTRPTSDRTREALFNILEHASWAPPLEGARVMDLFAGSGALGFEAMSRGASFGLFVDTSASARGAIRDNAEALNLLGVARIHRRSATALGDKPTGLGPPFSLAFLDPPYAQADTLIPATIAALITGAWLQDHAMIVIEHPHTWSADELDDALAHDTRRYGAASISFLSPRPRNTNPLAP